MYEFDKKLQFKLLKKNKTSIIKIICTYFKAQCLHYDVLNVSGPTR